MACVSSFVGLTTVDLIYRCHQFPTEDSKNTAAEFGIFAGGPATNASVAFAHLGGRALLHSNLGKTALTDVVLGDIQNANVEFFDLTPRGADLPPISSIIVSPRGLRTIVSGPQQDRDSPTEYLDLRTIAASRTLLVDGFNLSAAKLAAQAVRAAQGTVVLDGDSWRPGLIELLPFVNIVICGENFRVPGMRDLPDLASYLQEFGIYYVAQTRGPRSILVSDPAGEIEIDILHRNVVDTLGAGDIFHGAFCYYFCVANEFRASLEQAALIAGASTESFGTRGWMRKVRESDLP